MIWVEWLGLSAAVLAVFVLSAWSSSSMKRTRQRP